jgi:type IX secretion system PorP/SprF family membrane protein
MKKFFVKITIAAAGLSGVAVAQQDPQFTQFMFNKLIYNPGYAGTSGAICGVAQYRQQWLKFSESVQGPSSMAFAGDMRLPVLPIGVGINVITDRVNLTTQTANSIKVAGALKTFYLRGAASYNILRVGRGTLGLGLDLGILQRSIVNDWIVPEPLKNDPRVPGKYGDPTLNLNNPNLNAVSLDLGVGVFYQIPGKFYAGLSSLHVPGATKKQGTLRFTNNRHYYFMTGYTFQLNAWSKLTPNILWKSSDSKSYTSAGDGGATNIMNTHSMDMNLTYLWSDMIWVGGSYRLSDAASVLLGYQGKAMEGNALGYKIGLSYDLPSANLRSSGSYELILGVCYTPKVKKGTTYGNDRFLD